MQKNITYSPPKHTEKTDAIEPPTKKYPLPRPKGISPKGSDKVSFGSRPVSPKASPVNLRTTPPPNTKQGDIHPIERSIRTDRPFPPPQPKSRLAGESLNDSQSEESVDEALKSEDFIIPSSETHPPSLPEAYYYPPSKDYWVRDGRDCFMQVSETAMKARLRDNGFSKGKAGDFSPIDKAVIEIQDEHRVHYVGPLAGFRSGPHQMSGRQILVTVSPNIIEPVDGGSDKWPTLSDLIFNLFDQDDVQTAYFFGWLKLAYQALRAGKLFPGQVVVLAGPKDCGKSLLQKIITHVLGGRKANPIQYMSADTSFNSELFGAEHLAIEDGNSDYSNRSRSDFGNSIKNFVAVEEQRCHPKGRDAVMLTPFWRLTISVNEDPESLRVLPKITDSVSDKIMLFKCVSPPKPLPGGEDFEERGRFWKKLEGELPHLLYDLLHRFEIPSEYAGKRFGIKPWHHPEIYRAIHELSAGSGLLELLDDCACFLDDDGTALRDKPLKGSAADFEAVLLHDLDGLNRTKAKQFFHGLSKQQKGEVFGDAQKSHPDRVRRTKVNGATIWIVYPPNWDFETELQLKDIEPVRLRLTAVEANSCRI